MKIKDLNYEIEGINNEIEYYLKYKELVIDKYENRKSIKENHFYIICSDIESKIDKLYEKRKILMDEVEKKMKQINEYDTVLKTIIFYKEECLEEYTWQDIAKLVNYSDTQCRNIYKKYKQKRDVD